MAHALGSPSAQQGESEKSRSTIMIAVLTGFLALMATLGAAVVKGFYDTQLERQRFQSELVLRAMQSTSFAERVASLRFMLETHLITDNHISAALEIAVQKSKTDPAVLPQIAPVGTAFPSPIVQNARVFLLSGVQKNVPVLDSLREDLARAGYAVMGTRVIVADDSRPPIAEVTYFNQDDSSQAAAITAILKGRLPNSQLSARRRVDPKAKPGYIEIWLGKQ